MKKVIGIALVLLLACAVMASADMNNWIISIQATDPLGGNYAGTLRLGWKTGQTNGTDASPTNEAVPPAGANPGASLAAVGAYHGDNIYLYDYRQSAATDPRVPKVYNLAVWNAIGAGGTPLQGIKVSVKASSSAFPYADLWYFTVDYWNGQGYTTVKYDAAHQLSTAGDVFNLPALAAAGGPSRPEIIVTAGIIPEPGSMLALGSGLVGLVGFAIRRRR